VELFARTTEDVLSLAEFKELLDSGKKLKIKFGTDVTASFLHIGHAVNLWMMREMQERGHLVQFLVGDFTTLVGDPTGRSGARTPPSRESIERDAEAFIRQVGKVLIVDDPAVFEVRRNSEWWDKYALCDFMRLANSVTSTKLLSRDMFRARLESGGEVRVDEMLYPILQGWDSVELDSDLTIVGSDQLFNESMGRAFQERAGKRPQVVITTRITPGLEGVRKQSKTLGNFVAIDDDARTMFGKAMSLPDRLVRGWLEVYTSMPMPEINALCATDADPRAAKVALARALVERWHGAQAGCDEEAWFERTFSSREFPDDAPCIELDAGDYRAIDLLALVAPEVSRSELRRLIASGAIEAKGRGLGSPDEPVALRSGEELELRVGRRRFFRITSRKSTSP
jgi:tyrosyl-tRNA synthetase